MHPLEVERCCSAQLQIQEREGSLQSVHWDKRQSAPGDRSQAASPDRDKLFLPSVRGSGNSICRPVAADFFRKLLNIRWGREHHVPRRLASCAHRDEFHLAAHLSAKADVQRPCLFHSRGPRESATHSVQGIRTLPSLPTFDRASRHKFPPWFRLRSCCH